ncbi:MAG: DinB family protein [Phycisphaerales bacterium]
MAKKAKAAAKKAAKKPAPKKAAKPAAKNPAKASKPVKSAGSSGPSHGDFLAHAINHVKWSHDEFMKFTNGFTQQNATTIPHGHETHALWQVGHLAHTYDWFGTVLGTSDGKCPEGYDKLFGGGSKPVDDPLAYPSWDDVKDEFGKARDRFIKLAANTKDALGAPVGDTGGWITTKLQSLDRAAWHNGWHLGQISTVRKALGMPKVY